MKTLRCALLVMITAVAAAPFAARTQTPPAHAAESVLAPSVVAQLLTLNAASGRDGEMPAPIAVALGLSTAGQPWPDRQVAVVSNDTGAVHAVAVGLGGEKDIILSVRGPVAISAFRVRRDGTLVSATEYFTTTKLTSPMQPAEARSGFAEECAFWAAHVDRLLAPA